MTYGASLALLSAALFGASTPFAKILLGHMDPWTLAGLLYLGSGAGLGFFHLARRAAGSPSPDAPVRLSDLPWLAGAILTGGVAGPLLLMIGLTTTPGATAALLLNLEGLATMLIAWFVFRESTDRQIVAGALAILLGACVLAWPGAAATAGWGALAIAGACLCWGIDNNLTRQVSASDPLQLAMLKGLVAGLVNLALAAAQGHELPLLATALAAGLIGLLGYGVSLVLFVLALRHIGTARTGAYFSTAPFIGAVLALFLLGDSFTVPLAIASGLMAAGLYLHLAERHEHEHVHEAIEHEHRHTHDAHHQHTHEADDPVAEHHSHRHRHARLIHRHRHYPDLHHRHSH